MKQFWIVLCFGLLLVAYACNVRKGLPSTAVNNNWKSRIIPETTQYAGGNAQKGFDYLIYGDYIGSGIPYEFYIKKFRTQDTTFNRTGDNALLEYTENAFLADNGVTVVSGNCFTCHASTLNGKTVPGLGKSPSDFSDNKGGKVKLLTFFTKNKYGKKSEEWAAFENYKNFINVVTPYIITEKAGVNPAFRLEEACAMHRNPEDLTYKKEPNFDMIDYTIASDVPPLWNVKKKNGLYYNGMGRGDFSKLLMQAAVLGIKDSTAAREVQQNFEDVLAWMHSLEPPQYPKKLNLNLLKTGKTIFENQCKGCHGTYGEKESYPSKVISLDIIKTDPYYAKYFSFHSGLVSWYNQSWFAKSYPKSLLVPSDGYVAPPLDGIWATAPYLHNGSVPNLETLLNSPERPKYWKRSQSGSDYDHEKVGWKYETRTKGGGKNVYDTTLPSYSNGGHTFGDRLSKNQRKAVIEYLKTL